MSEFVNLLRADEAMVYTIKDGCGFCKDASRIYFSMTGLPADIEDGDILTYAGIFESPNGPQLILLKHIGNIYDRIKNLK